MEYTVPLKVNGTLVEITVGATTTLLDALRVHLRITGPKKGCNTGDCSSCTVLLNGKAINSCLVLAVNASGKEVTTVEGLGSIDHPHPLQEAFYQHQAAQCGFCTPGMVLTGKALLDRNPRPTRAEVVEAISGNLCRCTGYVKIVDAILAASQTLPAGSGASMERG